MTRIVVNKRVRALLAELRETFGRFDSYTRICCDRNTSMVDAVNAGADKEHCKAVILGLAHQINQACDPKSGKDDK